MKDLQNEWHNVRNFKMDRKYYTNITATAYTVHIESYGSCISLSQICVCCCNEAEAQ